MHQVVDLATLVIDAQHAGRMVCPVLSCQDPSPLCFGIEAGLHNAPFESVLSRQDPQPSVLKQL